jgi:hypothetical protein
LVIENIVLRSDIFVDFFVLSPVYGGIGYFVSEDLKIEMEKLGCTRIVFKEPNDISIV